MKRILIAIGRGGPAAVGAATEAYAQAYPTKTTSTLAIYYRRLG